jgi:hypothetical protein
VSVHVSSWAWKQAIGDDGAKLVLLKLADSANDDGVSWPKRETLRSECEAGHEDTVKRRLRKLRDLDLVLAVPWFGPDGRQTSSTYVLPHRGVLSGERLWKILEQTPRKGAPAVSEETLLAVDAVGSFLRSGGASVHPLDFGSGGASTHPSGGAPAHPSIEEPSFEPSTRANALVPADAGEREHRRSEITLALSAELVSTTSTLTGPERRKWHVAVAELVNVGATAADVAARCAAYRRVWPSMQLTPNALVSHWSMLGTHVEIASAEDPLERWFELSVPLLGRDCAHEVLDDMPSVDAARRTAMHVRIDGFFDAESEAA